MTSKWQSQGLASGKLDLSSCAPDLLCSGKTWFTCGVRIEFLPWAIREPAAGGLPLGWIAVAAPSLRWGCVEELGCGRSETGGQPEFSWILA